MISAGRQNFDIRDFSDFLRKQRDYKYVPTEMHLEHMVKPIDTDKWNINPQHEDERDLKDFIHAININSIIDKLQLEGDDHVQYTITKIQNM